MRKPGTRFSIRSALLITAVCAICIRLWVTSLPPSIADWRREAPPDGRPVMDECYAYEHFYGKSKAEAMDLLEESDMYYIEDFSYMPLEPFNYYFPVLLNYVLTEPRDEKSDAASMLLGLVRIETEFRTGKVDKHWDQINIALNEIALHQDDFGANEEIYGSFPRQVKLIRTLRLSQ